MSSFEYIEDVKKELAQYMNIRTVADTSYKIEVVVGESGFVAGAREVVKKIIRDVHDMNRSDILIIQIDDTEYKDNHTVVLVTKPNGEKTVHKNINIQNLSEVFKNIVEC